MSIGETTPYGYGESLKIPLNLPDLYPLPETNLYDESLVSSTKLRLKTSRKKKKDDDDERGLGSLINNNQPDNPGGFGGVMQAEERSDKRFEYYDKKLNPQR